MREINVRCKWESVHTIEVPDDCPRIFSGDLGGLLDISGDDVQSHTAELVDWHITDWGPDENVE